VHVSHTCSEVHVETWRLKLVLRTVGVRSGGGHVWDRKSARPYCRHGQAFLTISHPVVSLRNFFSKGQAPAPAGQPHAGATEAPGRQARHRILRASCNSTAAATSLDKVATTVLWGRSLSTGHTPCARPHPRPSRSGAHVHAVSSEFGAAYHSVSHWGVSIHL
jgi:hypothetical protein